MWPSATSTPPDIYALQTGDKLNPNYPDQLWINDGDGVGFTQLQIPEATTGNGDFVLPIDYDHNGYTDFLVLNGHGTPGPVQLIAFFPQG